MPGNASPQKPAGSRADFLRVCRALAARGVFDGETEDHAPRLPWKEPGFEAYVRELETKGVDRGRLLAMLTGNDPRQPFNLILAVNLVRRDRVRERSWCARHAKIVAQQRQYRLFAKLAEDEALRQATRAALRRDLTLIGAVLAFHDAPKALGAFPKAGRTVRPGTDLARQGFWSAPMVALVTFLQPLLGSKGNAYAATARLFHLAFGYPDEPTLVKRRVLHARKKPSRPHP